ncbi:hypothetical protein P378_10760 [Desulforamulus profundi]|uniref:Uncharacterized protein n=1 Tax=Desulforamulus profundi TaxID=1383067 RepID=A0A2C6MF70_9FIRM|nr:hypothetical protein [Desulforamulus profundi]PHJ38305.1 hypothetical protein P378_10760 [Desulforamulus profundi]
MMAEMDQIAERLNQITALISPIQGWVSNQAGRALYQTARFHAPIPTVVELGSWRGSESEDLHKKMLEGYQENQLYGFIVFDDVPSWPGPTKVVSELPGWYRQVSIRHNQCIVQKVE